MGVLPECCMVINGSGCWEVDRPAPHNTDQVLPEQPANATPILSAVGDTCVASGTGRDTVLGPPVT